MKFTQTLLALVLSAAALAVPTPTIEERATTICGQWDTVATGSYTLYQDLWGEAEATSGSQCTTFDSLSGTTIKWSTAWTWAGGSSDVKSFANVVVTQSTIREISAISSIESTWDWTYTGTSIVADVAYDMFTSSTSTGSDQYEIMIWLAALGGAGPISATGSAIATVTIDGYSWELYEGLNGAMTVYSFVASSTVSTFSGNLLSFFTYLIDYQGFPASQYLVSLGAGSEPFTGTNAVFTTSAYSVVVAEAIG